MHTQRGQGCIVVLCVHAGLHFGKLNHIFFPKSFTLAAKCILSVISRPAARNVSTESYHSNETNSRNSPCMGDSVKWNEEVVWKEEWGRIKSKSEYPH